MRKSLKKFSFSFALFYSLALFADSEISIEITITPPDQSGTLGFYAPISTIEYFFNSSLVDAPDTGINANIQSLYDTYTDPAFVLPTNPLELEIVASVRALAPEDVASVQQTLSDIALGSPSFSISWNALNFSLDGNIIAYDPVGDPIGAGMINLIRVSVAQASTPESSIPYTLYSSGVSSIPDETVLVEVQFVCPNVDLSQVSIEDVEFTPDVGPAVPARFVSGPLFADENENDTLRSCRGVFEIQSFLADGILKFTWVDALQRIYYSSRVHLGVIIGNPGTVIGNAGNGDNVFGDDGFSAEGPCGSLKSSKNTTGIQWLFLGIASIFLIRLRKRSRSI